MPYLAQSRKGNRMFKALDTARKARKAFILLLVGGSLGIAVLFAYRAYSARLELLETTVQTQNNVIE